MTDTNTPGKASTPSQSAARGCPPRSGKARNASQETNNASRASMFLDVVDRRSFSDEHGTAEQRFYNILCIAYGSDPGTFASAADPNNPATQSICRRTADIICASRSMLCFPCDLRNQP